MQDWFLNLVRCPIEKTGLQAAEDSLLQRLNDAIAAGRVTNRLGTAIQEPLKAGLVNESGTYFYAVQDDIPSLIPDEAIELAQLSPEADK